MMHTETSRDVAGIVAAAIVNDKVLDAFDALDPPRQRQQRLGKVLGFVEARYLDD
ncbi:MAG TPA: hypothetical protein VGN60_11445 [Devosia sp.]|jgi:hypothetical protein|nr:hypothetical protein [Devosia sp.]